MGLIEASYARCLQVFKDLSDPENPHHDGNDSNPIQQPIEVEGVSHLTADHVRSDIAQDESEGSHADGFDQRFLRQVDQDDQAQNHQAEIFGWTELESQAGHRCGEQHETDDADRSRNE